MERRILLHRGVVPSRRLCRLKVGRHRRRPRPVGRGSDALATCSADSAKTRDYSLIAGGDCPFEGRCPSRSINVDAIEPTVWADVERFLRDPGDVLDELDGLAGRETQGAIAEAESITLARALDALEQQRKQALTLNIRGRLPDPELDAELDRIGGERTELEARVAALEPSHAKIVPQEARDLAEARALLDAGLTDEQRQEIVRLLVGVVVHSDALPGGRKSVKAVVTYRFPCVVPTRTGIREGLNYPTGQPVRAADRRGSAPPGPIGNSG